MLRVNLDKFSGSPCRQGLTFIEPNTGWQVTPMDGLTFLVQSLVVIFLILKTSEVALNLDGYDVGPVKS